MGRSFSNQFAFFSQAYLSGKPKWGVGDIPDLSGKVAIVTGGSSGIGKEIAKALLSHNAKVYIATRNPNNAKEAISDLHQQTGKDAIFISLDLADLSSVKAAAEYFHSKEKHLHILYNNGGIMFPPIEETTPAGYDLSFAVNTLGHFYFTKLLIPTLVVTFRETGERPRVVNVVSGATYVGAYNIEALRDGPARRGMSLIDLYGQSKIAQLLFSEELGRLYGDEGIIAMAVNPGNVKSNLARYTKPGIEKFSLRLLQIYSAEWGALTPLYAGTSPEGSEFNGQFFIPWARVGKAREFDPKLSRDLWNWMEEEIKGV